MRLHVPRRGALTRWLAKHPKTVDAALAGVVLALFEMPAFDPYRHDGGQLWPFWGFAIAGPLLWRRQRPVLATSASLVGSLAALLTRSGPNWGALSQTTVLIGPAFALASASSRLPRQRSQQLTGGVAVALVAVSPLAASAPDALIAQLVLVVAAWATGEGLRARRHEIALLEELVDRRGEQAADAERARIGRELHDIVAHQLGVIAIQAGAVRLAAGEASALAPGLHAIEEASRAALGEVRQALGVLRADDHTAGIAPQPGIDQLDTLVERLRQSGLPVQLTTRGDLSDLPATTALSAYRIVQEALTNVVNHAGPVPTQVQIEHTGADLQVEVRNDPPAESRKTNTSVGGHGLVGMRERAAACGGLINAGPLPSGGYAVTARLPLA